MTRRLQVLRYVVFTGAVAAGACGRAGDQVPVSALRPDPVQLLTAAGGTSRGLSLAARGEVVAAVWATTEAEITDVFTSVSSDGGHSFAPAVRVNNDAGDARVNGEQPPRVAIAGSDIVVIWSSRANGLSRVRVARSADGGRTFSPAVTAHDDGLTGARGWASLAIDDKFAAHLTWLDGRNAAAPARASAPTPPTAGQHMHSGPSPRQDIVHAVLGRDGAREEHQVAANVCFCCKTSTAVKAGGPTYVAWRHIYPVNLRDMAVARSDDGGRTFGAPVRVSEDGWQLESCPEDGPSIGVTDDDVLHIAWPTLAPGSTDRKAVFYSYSTDRGRSFSRRRRIDSHLSEGIAAHPQLVAANNRVAIVWEESGTDGRVIKLAPLGQKTGEWAPAPDSTITMSTAGSAVYPAVAITPSGFVVGWTLNRDGTSQIQISRVPTMR